ncbi:ATP-binding protein [Oscillatoria acuminata]|uniref:Circadian input-output histidine kinase CikA n=1 Tax=Oscillatoria acuminata PCC 6304 TaxID=56110 RepID=K9TDQ5_9CYAN|nr:ATP-binding protein [Oscillatoria acuminata]AFY81007.1 signal transduction histidine kinase [Oscillatoria acuminata PCC 6304]
MVKSGQSSFRRILLSRILLLSVPVLLLGEYVTYRKARSSLLETARQNLTESAVRKGDSIHASLESLQANLLTASESVVLHSGSVQASQNYIEQLAQRLPTKVQCVQLSDVQTTAIIASTCGNQPLSPQIVEMWQQQGSLAPEMASGVPIKTVLSQNNDLNSSSPDSSTEPSYFDQLKLVLSAPVYLDPINPLAVNNEGIPDYALTIRSTLGQRASDRRIEPGSLTGYTVVIDQDGTILEHGNDLSRVGRNIQDEVDAKRLENIIRNALRDRQDFFHLFNFDQEEIELLSGYTAIPSPLSTGEERKWVILAVTPLDNALAGLKDIQNVLFTLILGLLAANLLATLYLTRDLALPIEKLQDYALNIQCRATTERVPHNLNIREFNRLAEALDSMVERLKAWAEELEAAWKEAKTANQLKNEFLATISHELRTPLNAILGCIRLVRDDCCDNREEEIEFLQRADDAAIHLLNIINDILDISKIEAGTLSVVMEQVDVKRLIKEAIELQQSALEQKGLQLQFLEDPQSITVEADPAKLKQALLNLIGNAIKFTDTGRITISTRIEGLTKGQSFTKADGENGSLPPHLVISVQDTGIGIAPDQQQKLFQPFVMVDGSRTRPKGGTGLGLAISRNLIELMGGIIRLDSKGIGQGTTVEVVLPILHSSPSIPVVLDSKTAKQQNS